MIRATGLKKLYRGRPALDGVDLEVAAGEIFGLLGPNGAGKSTLVRILTTLTMPDDGEAQVAGADVRRQPQLVRQRIGYVPQGWGVDREATGWENLILQGQFYRFPPQMRRQRAQELLERLSLTEAAHRMVRGYSGGMKRRLDIALALLPRPRVLFLDEPTVGLDPESRAVLWADLQRLRAHESITVLFSTHYLDEAEHLADRLAVLDRGRVVAFGRPSELKAELPDRIRLRLPGPTEEVKSLLLSVPRVREVSFSSGEYLVLTTEGPRTLPLLLERLNGSGLRAEEVFLDRPDLNEVYLNRTGRHFAEADLVSLEEGSAP